jgi:hypothetical protein
MPKIPHGKNSAQAKARKYSNHTQRVQGIDQVEDPTLTQGERNFLKCLAAYDVNGHGSHPGNARLMRSCAIKSRTGVNYIVRKLVAKQLIEVLQRGDGKGNATVYRICVEHPAFPSPPEKKNSKPSSPDLTDSTAKPSSPDLRVSEEKPSSEDPETVMCEPANRQVNGFKPLSLDCHTDLNLEYKARIKTTEGVPHRNLPRWQQLEELGLSKHAPSRLNRGTLGDQYANLIRSHETPPGYPESPDKLPTGAYLRIEALLLERGTRFDSDPDVLALVGKINQRTLRLFQKSPEQKKVEAEARELKQLAAEAESKAKAKAKADEAERNRRDCHWAFARGAGWTQEEFLQEYERSKHLPYEELCDRFPPKYPRWRNENAAFVSVSSRFN